MLEIRDLRKSYGELVALDGVDLTVSRGETVVIMGPSGCGKSTLIRCVNRLTEPDSGTILVKGQDIMALDSGELQEFRRNVGFVFQQFNLIGRLTVLENVMFHLVLGGMDLEEARSRGARCPDKVGLKGAEQRRPHGSAEGSSNEWNCQGSVTNPEIMLWDEPTASLDQSWSASTGSYGGVGENDGNDDAHRNA